MRNILNKIMKLFKPTTENNIVMQEQEEDHPTNIPTEEECRKNLNIKAFLDMLAYAEGTIGRGDDGYNVLVGGELFDDYTDHPNVLVQLPNLGIASSAAGRYQILNRYWKHYKQTLNLPDFSPMSQDKYAINQIRERKALRDVEEGRIRTAIYKCGNIWASLPNNSYRQRQVPYSRLLKKFEEYGGKLTED